MTRWSPIVVELFMLDWLPRKVSLYEAEVVHLPTVLRAWLRFVAEQRGFDERLAGEMLAAVDEFEAGYREAMADSSRLGPAGALVKAMQEEGVDLTDPAAVQAWMTSFNARPWEERFKHTGGPWDD
jgi:hypothetical protein